MSNLSTSVNGGESIRVIVRCRPMSEAETASGYQNVVSVDSTRGVIEVRNPNENDQPPKSFTFDAVYDQNSKQIDLYYESFRDLIDSVLNGFNGTIFAYGQTGTGKTHTMEGQSDDPEQRGVIPNAIDHIFQHIASANSQQQYLVRASYLEIYQDQIRDLLSRDQKKRLELKERPDRGVYVDGIESFITKSIQEIRHVQTVGNSNRSVGQTNMNEHSSRSHAIFIITIECSEPGLDGENHIRVGRLNLVDLAGSERQAKTGATGERLKEATKINLSLSALGNVISALVDGGKGSYVPYRDSKLTRLLQDSLGGNSKTVMVANVGPASYNIDETLGTLRYANRAKNIKNKPRINEDPKDAMLRQFQETIAELKQKLEKRMTSSRKRRRQDDPEVYKQKLDAEREELLKNNEMLSEEKDRMLAALEERAAQLAREREASGQIESKIREMESKLLTGGENLLDQTRQQQALLKQRKIELAEQKRKEREILQQLEEQDETTNEVQETFNNLQQEVEIKTKRLKKLTAKQLQLQQQIHETIEQNNDDRQQLESSISNMNKELKLKWLIVENFIPFNTIQQLKERYKFDDEEDKWVEVGSEVKVNFSKRPFARRLTTDHERQIMSQLRQRFLRQAPTIEFHPPGTTLTDVFNRPIPVHVTDEQMRFGTENLLNFNSLISCPLPVRDDYEQACREEMKNPLSRTESSNLVIDISKIPVPKARPPSRRSISSSSTSKNVRARSVTQIGKSEKLNGDYGATIAVMSVEASDGHSQRPPTSTTTKPPQVPHRTRSSALIFPKARGFVNDRKL
ncbi:hypothetical protein M3Y94_00943400 [Aphelenchoides besseyi]|nr:hypothetical protein M3Y94_00943400 [Aphelenchoides besseyi]KAI6224877.1 Kinesin-like protein [Aphelenchoides besseyi]